VPPHSCRASEHDAEADGRRRGDGRIARADGLLEEGTGAIHVARIVEQGTEVKRRQGA
jgi:hypothetical protein